MKKAIRWSAAMAACGAACMAHAQPGVVMYGVMSTALRYTSHIDGGKGHLAELVPSGIGGTRLGLRGQEDLGGGAKAEFVLESGLNADTGTTAYPQFFGRQAYVGISAGWGSLSAGRQYNAINNVGWSFNPLARSWGNFWSDSFYLGGDVFFQGYRIDNSLVYKRTDGAFTTQLEYGFGEQAGAARKGATVGGGIMYQRQGLGLGAAYDRHTRRDGRGSIENHFLGGSYAIGDVSIYLGHMGRRDSAPHARFQIRYAGLGYQASRRLHLSGAYYRYGQRGHVTTQYQAVPVLLGAGNADALAFVAEYALSARVHVFAQADWTVARDGAVGRETEYWAGKPATQAASLRRAGVMAGVRYVF